MATDHTPDDESQRIYARHKRHHDAAAELKPEIRERATKDLLAGSTPAELAKLTGLSDEFFRRIARAVGAERKRPPTVGKLAADKPAEPRSAAAGPWQGSPSPRPGRPPAHLPERPGAESSPVPDQTAGDAHRRGGPRVSGVDPAGDTDSESGSP